MNRDREELKRIIEELPEDLVPVAAALLRKLREPTQTGRRADSARDTFPGSELVRRAIAEALAAAHRTGRQLVDVDHLLVGLLTADQQLAVRVLGSFERFHSVVDDLLPSLGQSVAKEPHPDLPWSQVAKDAWHTALVHGAGKVHPEALLIALVATEHERVASVLRKHGTSSSAIRMILDH